MRRASSRQSKAITEHTPDIGIEAISQTIPNKSRRKPFLRAYVVGNTALRGFVSKNFVEAENKRVRVIAASGAISALSMGAVLYGYKNGLAAEFARNDTINQYPTNILGQLTGAWLRKSSNSKLKRFGEVLIQVNLAKADRNGMPVIINRAPIQVINEPVTEPEFTQELEPVEVPLLETLITNNIIEAMEISLLEEVLATN